MVLEEQLSSCFELDWVADTSLLEVPYQGTCLLPPLAKRAVPSWPRRRTRHDPKLQPRQKCQSERVTELSAKTAALRQEQHRGGCT